MESVDGSDARTFKVNFSGDGASKLKEKVMDKLKEFMGDYTDDTLVEYVIVLLRNGRQKEEARNELNVFLGDDSHSFVSWLWDHMSSNLNLYVESQESNTSVAAQTKPASEDHFERNDLHQLDSPDVTNSKKLYKSRHNREWKGLIRDVAEPPPLRSSENDNIHAEEKSYRKAGRGRRSASPKPHVHRKRSRHDEKQYMENGEVSQATVNVPRRLLQSAVRDAVGTSRPSNLSVDPTVKRLRSVVSTSTGDSSLVNPPRRIQSIARIPNAMTTVIKAVAEAAEDVTKVKYSGSVFDRLGRGVGLLESSTQEYRRPSMEYGEFRDANPIPHQTMYHEVDYDGQYAGDMAMPERDIGLASDSASDNEGYDGVNILGRRIGVTSHSGTSAGNKGMDSLMMQYSLANNIDMHMTWNKDQDQPVAGTNNTRKIVNISVNVNTWKPPRMNEPREVVEVDGRKSVQERKSGAGKSNIPIVKNTDLVSVGNTYLKPALDNQTELKKTPQAAPGLYSATQSLEDADSRTIFISNVNFGATKDGLSRHFSKFGDVLKVIIVTDAATGLPKGAAYLEFMRKESADDALSLDGTSFMSRIVKVVKRNFAHQETVPTMTWPRVARGSPYSVARLPFPRGYHGSFRPRLPILPGARSLQWKRDAPGEASSSTTRSLTYVRSEPNTGGNSGAA